MDYPWLLYRGIQHKEQQLIDLLQMKRSDTVGMFCSKYPPPNPTKGTSWFDITSQELYVYYDCPVGASWVKIRHTETP